MRGKRHLLKKICRRKSLQSHQVYEEGNLLSIEAEVERLHKDKIEMMQEVIDLQQQQRGTHQYLETVNEKLQAAEDRQKQMVSSLAKVFQIPRFKKDQGRISSSRMVRKFVKNQPHDQECGLDLMIPVDDKVSNLDIHTEVLPLQLQQVDVQELAQSENPIIKEQSVFDLDFEATAEYFISSPVNFSDECVVKQEDIWSSDFETITAMPGSSNEMWNDVGSYELPEFGVRADEFSNFWNLEASGAENSLIGETNQYGF